MPKPTCLKCSNVATIAMYCAKCYRNRQPEVPVAHRPEPRVLNPLPAETPEPRVLNTCEGPGCEVQLPPQSGKGRRRKFCSPACRERSYRNAD